MELKIKKIDVKEDSRGSFFEVLRSEDVSEKTLGQISFTTARPGEIKGNHYHTRKIEWFCVVKGKGLMIVLDEKTGERKEYPMGEGNMIAIEIIPPYPHAIKNIGIDDMYVLLYVDEPFNPSDPDTYPFICEELKS